MADLLRRWWVQVLLVFVASRVVSTAIILVYAAQQVANPWTGAHPDYLSYSGIWDSEWYRDVVLDGYPSTLPLDQDGHVYQNTWAFMPAYPFLVAALSWITTVPLGLMAVIVSVLCAAGAALVFYRIFATWLPHLSALGGVALMLFNPVSPILQMGYAESMHLLLLGVCLLLLVRRRYLLMLPFVVVMSFTRPSGLAFALAMAGHVLVRWWRHRRRAEPFPPAQVAGSLVVGAVSAIAGYGWVIIAALVTGRPDAYTATEFYWRLGYVGDSGFFPFLPWVQGADWWARWVGVPGWVGLMVLVLILVVVAMVMFSPWMRRLGVDLRLWVGAWLIYLLAVFFPQSSTWRLLLPASPALAALAVPRSRWIVPVALALGVVGQWFWFGANWAWVPMDWTPP